MVLDTTNVQVIVASFTILAGLTMIFARRHVRFRDLHFITGIAFTNWGVTLLGNVADWWAAPLWVLLVTASVPYVLLAGMNLALLRKVGGDDA